MSIPRSEPVLALALAASLAAVIASPATAQVTSSAVATRPVQIYISNGINSYHGMLPAGPTTGYSLTVPPGVLVPGRVEARLGRLGPTGWRLTELAASAIVPRTFTARTGPHRTELDFVAGAEPVAGAFEVALRLNEVVAFSTYVTGVTIEGAPVAITPNGPATVVPVRIEAGQRARAVATTAISVQVPVLSFPEWVDFDLDVVFREAPGPCTVTDLGAGCGSTELDAFGDPMDPQRQILRVRDVAAGPRLAVIAVGTAPGRIPFGIHPNTGQQCTLWTNPLSFAFVTLDAGGVAEIGFNATLASGVDLVLQAATVDASAVLSLSRGRRIRCP